MTEPDDRELEQYLKGDSPLSRRYREASGETAPPELDEAILAQARHASRARPPGVNRWLTPVALAASVLLGINLGWNVYKAEPVPGEGPELHDAAPSTERAPLPLEKSAADAPSIAPPAAPEATGQAAAAPDARGPALREADLEARGNAESMRKAEEQERVQAKRQAAESMRRSEPQAQASEDALAAPMAAVAPALSEPEKIDRLIAFIGALQGAVFIRNGDEHGAPEAAKHLQMKREKAGDRVRTADDFIRLCASHSYLSREAYLIRFADGRTRTAEDVLREELARIENR